jgi:hypothetical protein
MFSKASRVNGACLPYNAEFFYDTIFNQTIMNNPYDHNAANEQKWSQKSATFDERRFDIFRFMQRELISTIRIIPPSNFLDVGCGTGWAVTRVAKMLAGKGHVKYHETKEFTALFSQAGLKHISSRRLKFLYPLKVHVGEKESQ